MSNHCSWGLGEDVMESQIGSLIWEEILDWWMSLLNNPMFTQII